MWNAYMLGVHAGMVFVGFLCILSTVFVCVLLLAKVFDALRSGW